MALSTEEFSQITQIVTQANEAQFDRLSEKLSLTVLPIRDNLQHHKENDEKIHEDMYNKLGDLSTWQTKLKTIQGFTAIIGMAGLGVATSVISAVIKGYL